MAVSCGPGSHFQSPSFRELLLPNAEALQDGRFDFPHKSSMYTPTGAQRDVVLCAAELFVIVEHFWFPI